jgi:type III pantothenate kinase
VIIAIDAGNTRIKWGVHDGATWLAQGACPTTDVARLGEISVVAGWPVDAPIVACNVAGEVVEKTIDVLLTSRFRRPKWLRPSAQACGVRNLYELVERLGADRWAALIGAREHVSTACLVVCAGTATTVDWLAANGEFRGGLILPGVDLMRASLARNTAQLPLGDGQFRCEPRNTLDAIASGCLHAQLGAIERMFAKLAAEPDAVCLLTGGAAPHLVSYLNIPFQLMDNLILDGLARFGASQ